MPSLRWLDLVRAAPFRGVARLEPSGRRDAPVVERRSDGMLGRPVSALSRRNTDYCRAPLASYWSIAGPDRRPLDSLALQPSRALTRDDRAGRRLRVHGRFGSVRRGIW